MRGVAILLQSKDGFTFEILDGLPALVRKLLDNAGPVTDVISLNKKIESVFGGLLWDLLGADIGRPMQFRDLLALTGYSRAYVFAAKRDGYPASLTTYADLDVPADGCAPAPPKIVGTEAEDAWIKLRTALAE